MWKVTKNKIDEDEEKCPLYRSCDFDEAKFKQSEHVKFRLLDDDGEVYFWGFMEHSDLHGTEDRAFAPLDDLGRGYGCTELQYR
jgi:hypothetical protein